MAGWSTFKFMVYLSGGYTLASSRITASAVRTENYLLNQPPHFLPPAGISPSAEPSASPPGPEIYQDLQLW